MKQFFSLKTQKYRSVNFYKFFLSYMFIVAVLLLIVGFLIHTIFFNIYADEVQTSSISSLTQVRDIVDSCFMDVLTMANKINLELKLTPKYVNERDYETIEAVRELQKYRSFYEDYIFDIILHYQTSSDILLSCNGLDKAQNFFDMVYKYNDNKKVLIESLIQNLDKPYIVPAENVTYYGENLKSLYTYIYPLPVDTKPAYGYVIFMIKGDYIDSIMKNLLSNYEGSAFILEDNSSIIASVQTGGEVLDYKNIISNLNRDSKIPSTFRFKTGNKEYIVMCVPSLLNQWYYVKVVSLSQFMHKVNEIKLVFNYLILIILIFSVLLSFILATKVYKPIQRLAEMVVGQRQDNSYRMKGKGIDEISMVLQKINEYKNENANLHSSLKSMTGMLKEQFLLSVINGKTNLFENTHEVLDLSGLKFDKPNFLVIYFLIDNYAKFTSLPKSNQELIKIAIKNICEELSLDIGRGYAIESAGGNGIALLLNIEADQLNKNNINIMVDKIKSFFEVNSSGNTLTAGIGNTYNFEGIHSSYEEARKASSYRVIKGNSSLIFYNDIENINNNTFLPSQKYIDQFLSAIKLGNYEKVESALESLLDTFLKQLPSPWLIQVFHFILLNSIKNISDDLGLFHISDVLGKMETDDNETVENFKIKVLIQCKNICDVIADCKESKNFELREKLQSYIEDHFLDSNMSLDMIAEFFSVSPSYITRYFKDQTGYPLMKYIDTLRMEKAKELLKTTNLPINEVVKLSGYVDEYNFARKFKKIEGMTPSQYRKVMTTG